MEFAFVFPRFKILSGAERLILKLAGALNDQGHNVSIVCHQFHPSCGEILHPGSGLYVSGARLDFFKNRYINAAFDYFRNNSLLKLIPGGVDAICCFGPALTLARSIRKKFRKPLLYFCYEPPRFLYTDKEVIAERLGMPSLVSRPVFELYRRRDQQLVRMVDGVLCNSVFGKEQIESCYSRSATVITHGLDPYWKSNRRNELRAKLGFTNSDIVVVTVNYLHPRKRVDMFVKTILEANQKNTAIRGLIIGEGPEKQKLRQQATGAINLVGFVPEHELVDYYQAGDIYLHTGRLETFGLSVIEASGNGLPVVSVREGGPLETVLEGQTGFLRNADPESLSQAILELAADPALRKIFGERGIDFVRNKYRWEKGAEDFVSAVKLTDACQVPA